MKRKYYLRGLGFGILVTALVFIIAGPSELSEEEIIKRAEKLGYTKVESVTPSIGIKELLETPAPSNTIKPEATPEPTQAMTESPVPTKAPEVSPEPTQVPQATLTPVPTPTETPKPTNTPMPTEPPKPTVPPVATPAAEVITAVISVERGNSATVVCNKIEAAGIVKDADKLRNYLINNNLTDYINIGSYTLSSDMSIERIAKLLTGR